MCKEVKQDKVADAIEEMMNYHASTCGDKYGKSELDTMKLIMSDNHGKSINIFNAYKYLARYMTSGYEKSDNRKDVIKAIHYLLFELARTEGQTEITDLSIDGLWDVNAPIVFLDGTPYPEGTTFTHDSNHAKAVEPCEEQPS